MVILLLCSHLYISQQAFLKEIKNQLEKLRNPDLNEVFATILENKPSFRNGHEQSMTKGIFKTEKEFNQSLVSMPSEMLPLKQGQSGPFF